MSSDVRKTLDSSPYSRTLKQYSIDEKLIIISHAKSHGNRAAGREFNVAESSIREWRKNEMKLINNKNNAAASSSSHSSTSSPASSAHNNNNNNHNKNVNHPMQLTTTNVLSKLMENGFGRRPQDEMLKQQLAHYAHLMMNMDMSSLTQLAPLLQLQQLHQRQQLQPQNQQQEPPKEPNSVSSSVVSTPSSVSSASPPPPASPVTSGSGRRKLRCPQKIEIAPE